MVRVFISVGKKLLKRAMWQELRKEGRDFITEREPLNAVVIDFYLWNFAKKHAKELETIPIHKTKTIFY